MAYSRTRSMFWSETLITGVLFFSLAAILVMTGDFCTMIHQGSTFFLHYFLAGLKSRTHNSLCMAVKLKERFKQIPGGLKFYQPETKWQPRPWASFDEIVNSLVNHRKANPFLSQKHGWSTDPGVVSAEVDAFNARICQQMGWADYITNDAGGAAAQPPFPSPHQPPPPGLSSRLKSVAAGGELLVEWIRNGAEAVPAEQAARRAEVCSTCQYNDKGDWTRYFTVPASNAIRAEVNKRREWKLETPQDDQLQVCEICSCPLKLKVHVPIKDVLGHIMAEVRAQLPDWCWIRKES